jgi:hypothetical protein
LGSRGAGVDLGAQSAPLKLHLEVLGRTQRSVLPKIAPLARSRGFYLAGGTGLALQLGHRRSVDFDWFRTQPIDDPLRLAAELRAAGLPLEIVRVEKGTLHAAVRRVRLSFLEYQYPLLRPLVEAPSCTLASREDIAAMKLGAVAQRGSKKDFVDIFALGQRFSLGEMLEYYRAKYRLKDVGHVLVALAYFDDADGERMPALLRRWAWSTMKATIRRWVAGVAEAR